MTKPTLPKWKKPEDEEESFESCSAPTHHLALADQFGIELGPVQGKVNVKVHSIESTIGRIHALEILLQVLAGEV
mgnify:CR=1 FL=1